jgi:hypothetical protein
LIKKEGGMINIIPPSFFKEIYKKNRGRLASALGKVGLFETNEVGDNIP